MLQIGSLGLKNAARREARGKLGIQVSSLALGAVNYGTVKFKSVVFETVV